MVTKPPALDEEPESLSGAFDALRELTWPDEVLEQIKDRRPPQERDWMEDSPC